ncbi:hypothetical protein LSAT2_011538 [Lamellibrachia satsuma]|nr:hypothetical protein LSAT2_011538 [Lamellibrachia satsuma]
MSREFCKNDKMRSPMLVVFLVTVFGGLLSEAAGDWMDCGGQRVWSRHYRCCDGVPHLIIFGKREACCGKSKTDLRREQCCNGVVSPKYGNRYPVHCCGRDTYHDKAQICCGDVVVSKVLGVGCCGNELFSRRRHLCCNGKLMDMKTLLK